MMALLEKGVQRPGWYEIDSLADILDLMQEALGDEARAAAEEALSDMMQEAEARDLARAAADTEIRRLETENRRLEKGNLQLAKENQNLKDYIRQMTQPVRNSKDNGEDPEGLPFN